MAQIGTVKVETPSGIKSLPVFAEGDSGSSVFEMVKVETPSGIGFIPMVEASGDATFPYIKVQTANHAIVHAHDAASLISFIDDFETGDLTHWSGDTGNYSVNSNAPVKEGTYSVKNDGATSNVRIGATTGKEAVPQTGDTWRFWVHPGAADSLSDTHYASDSTSGRNDAYTIRVQADGDVFRILKYDSGSQTFLASDTGPGTIDQSWFEVEVTHESNGDITATLFDSGGTQMSQLTVTDSTHITSGEFDHDNVQIEDGRGNGDAWDHMRIV